MTGWRWEYDPNADEVIKGLPAHVTAEAERLADELVALADVGVDITDIGEGGRKGTPGGLRRIPLLDDGWFYALPLPRMKLIAIVRVIPPYTDFQASPARPHCVRVRRTSRSSTGTGHCCSPRAARWRCGLRDGESVRRDAWVHTLFPEPGPTPGTAGPWVLRCLRPDGWHDLYASGTEPRFPVDYTVTSHFASTHPLSPFHGRTLVQKWSPDRRTILDNLELTTLRPDLTSTKHQIPAQELPLLLEREFGIHLDAADTTALVARHT